MKRDEKKISQTTTKEMENLISIVITKFSALEISQRSEEKRMHKTPSISLFNLCKYKTFHFTVIHSQKLCLYLLAADILISQQFEMHKIIININIIIVRN